ncbi:unnamed protein product [Ilex paraguariensis]|uniref:Uncharacterized protein n=1 Tax=Ilex paraguariensis TaxID=185542 RepID=A0ABC8SG70_9AQUA
MDSLVFIWPNQSSFNHLIFLNQLYICFGREDKLHNQTSTVIQLIKCPRLLTLLFSSLDHNDHEFPFGIKPYKEMKADVLRHQIAYHSNFFSQARSLVRKGDVISVTDPSLVGSVKIESIWRVTEVAIQCVEQHGASRPKMQEIILAIQDAIKIEKGTDISASSGCSKTQSSRKTLLTSFLDIESPDLSNGCLIPTAR